MKNEDGGSFADDSLSAILLVHCGGIEREEEDGSDRRISRIEE